MNPRACSRSGLLGVALAAIFGVALAGCSSTKAPTFRVAGVQMREATAQGTELLFIIEASNPNSKEIPLFEASYGVALGGGEAFSARRTPEATLRRYSTQTFTLPVAIPADRMPAGERVPYSFAATITYIMPGELAEILFDRDIKKPKSSLRDSGTLDFAGMVTPGATVGSAESAGEPVSP
jgi:hypothetical protein